MVSPFYNTHTEVAHQNVTFYTGVDFMNVTLPYIDYLSYNRGSASAIMGMQIGLGAPILAVMLALTSQRRTTLFYLNALAIVCMILHVALALYNVLGIFGSMNAMLLDEYYGIHDADIVADFFSNLFQAVEVLLTCASLYLQLRAVFETRDADWRMRLMAYSMVYPVMLFTVAIWMLTCLARFYVTAYPQHYETVAHRLLWCKTASGPLFAVTVTMFSLALIIKLGHSHLMARRAGHSNSMVKALLVMSLHTALIPAVLLVVGASPGITKYLSQISQSLAVISLPITALYVQNQCARPEQPAPCPSPTSPTMKEPKPCVSECVSPHSHTRLSV